MNKNRSYSGHMAMNWLFAVIIVFVLYVLQSIVAPMLFSVILAVLLLPVGERLEKWGLTRFFASLIALIVGVILLFVLVYFIISQTISISRDMNDIVDKFSVLYGEAQQWTVRTFGISEAELMASMEHELENSKGDIQRFINDFFLSIGNVLPILVLVPISVFFFMYYRDFFKAFFKKSFGTIPENMVEEVVRKVHNALQNYIVGQVTVMAIIAVLNIVGLWVLGIDHAIFFGALASFLMIIPYVGITIGSLLPMLFAFAAKDSYWYGIGVLAWFQVVQFFEGNFITPNIVGHKVSLNPLVSLLSIFLFSMLFGFSGMILALPLMAIIKVIFDVIPQTQAYGFLLSDPDKHYTLTERQKKKIQTVEEDIDADA